MVKTCLRNFPEVSVIKLIGSVICISCFGSGSYLSYLGVALAVVGAYDRLLISCRSVSQCIRM